MATSMGPVLRSKPRMRVLRGFTGNETGSLTRSLPVAPNQSIRSGNAVVAVSGKWELASDPQDHAVVYFAMHDAQTDANGILTYTGTDTDVLADGKLLALSSQGGFRIQTGYFEGDPAVGEVAVVASGSPASGAVTGKAVSAVAAQDDVIGEIIAVTDMSDNGIGGIGIATNSEAARADLTVVTIDTNWQMGRG